MTCSYCGTQLGQSEQRCGRCGRKDDDRLTGGFSLVTDGALAAAPRPVPQARVPLPRPSRDMGRAVQVSLFPDKLASSVVMIAPARTKTATRKPKTMTGKPAAGVFMTAPARTKTATRKPRTRTGTRVPEGQGKLEFLEAAPSKARTLGTRSEEHTSELQSL